uniref:Uncharacterized protein n=1 Tax=Zooxanthella nutricula TaxID=1333877 RepID=A0A7S2VLC0_9DINO
MFTRVVPTVLALAACLVPAAADAVLSMADSTGCEATLEAPGLAHRTAGSPAEMVVQKFVEFMKTPAGFNSMVEADKKGVDPFFSAKKDEASLTVAARLRRKAASGRLSKESRSAWEGLAADIGDEATIGQIMEVQKDPESLLPPELVQELLRLMHDFAEKANAPDQVRKDRDEGPAEAVDAADKVRKEAQVAPMAH